MLLIPPQVQAGAALVVAGLIFGGGWKVSAWHDAGRLALEAETHQRDVAKLQDDWAANLEAMRKRGDEAEAELAADREANAKRKAEADSAYQTQIGKLQASTLAAARDSQRVRDELAAAIAAARPSDGGGGVQQAGTAARCGDPSSAAACRLLARALDLAQRCVGVAGPQHAAVAEAVAAWPTK